MRTSIRAAGFTLVLFVVSAALAITASSQERRAGVVAGLQGTASVTRASLPEPRALKFRDDVYLRDEIVTGEASLARILLGGKALLTVRERSVVRITEAPGVSTVSLRSGRAAVNVLKERMRPGDSVEVVTPNATAAIRGTIVVAEVEPGRAGARSTITVLRGLIDVIQHDASGKAFGQAVAVSALQQVTVAGGRLSPVLHLTRQTADRIASDFRMSLRPSPVPPSVVESQLNRAGRDVAAGRSGGRSADNAAEKGVDRGGQKGADRGGERSADTGADERADRGADRRTDKGGDSKAGDPVVAGVGGSGGGFGGGPGNGERGGAGAGAGIGAGAALGGGTGGGFDRGHDPDDRGDRGHRRGGKKR